MQKDYYNILNVDKKASKEEIKKAYRSLAKKYHPDKHAGDKQMEDKFKEISEAYEILSDDAKRDQYDNPAPKGFGHGFGGMDDFFSSFFNDGGRHTNNTAKPRIITYPLVITLEEAYFGVDKKVTYTRDKIVGESTVCNTCNGVGFVDTLIQFGPSHVMNQRSQCPNCGGTGRVHKTEREERTISVKIRKGVLEGENLRVPEGGNMGINGVYGDLLLNINFEKHEKFKKIDNDLYLTINIPLPKYLLGGEITIPHFDGDLMVKLSQAVKNKQVLRLNNKGFERGNVKGAMYIEIAPKIPQSLTQHEIDLLNELGKSENFSE